MIIKTRAEARALLERRTRIANRANAHPQASLNIDLDDAYREMRKVAAQSKQGTFLVTTGALALPTTEVAAGGYVEVPVPTSAVLVRKLEAQFGSRWVPQEEVGFDGLRDRECLRTTNYVWAMLDQGVRATVAGNDGTADPGVIALAPVPTSGNYQLWYLPEHTSLTADSGAGGFYAYANQDQVELHIYLAGVKILISDNDSEGMLSGHIEMVKRYQAAIETWSPTKTGPKTWKRSRNY